VTLAAVRLARSAYVLQARWPIDDPEEFSELAVAAARRELRDITDRLQATLTGAPAWRTTGGYLVCEAPAVRRAAA
jgi:hypothetical protein